MNAVVCVKPGELKLVGKDAPASRAGQAILRIRRVGICGTDIHAFGGTQPYFTYPRILGHELSGELVSGDVAPDLTCGEMFTVLPYWSCGKCIACRRRKQNCCVNMQVCGVHVDGGMVEYLSVPSEMLIRGEGLTLDELAMVEPLAIGAHSVSRAEIQHGEFALVVGAGPIGLGIMQFCRLAGARVIALDINEKRLDFCRKAIRPDFTVNPLIEDVIATLRALTNNEMPTAVFDATGNRHAINGALDYLAHGGRYVLVGLQRGDLCFSHPEFHKRETTLMSSRNAGKADFEYVISCIKKKMLDPAALITHRLSFSDLETEFKTITGSEELVIKAMIDVGDTHGKRVVM